MYGWRYYDGGPGWVLMTIFMIVFWVLVIAGIIIAIRYFGRSRHEVAPTSAPLEVLRLRYARGEIDEEEFNRRRALLNESS